jgi:RimJ/RimL family protein N-acetyltransferase
MSYAPVDVVVPFTAPTLTGELVRLEPLTVHHVIPLAEAAAEDPHCFGPNDVPTDKIAMHRWVDEAIELRDDKDPLPYAIRRLADNTIVGSTRFWHTEFWGHASSGDILRPRHPNAVEVGKTWLSSSAQRTGCNTEAKLLMLSHAFETWGVTRVSMTADSRDNRSRQSIERLGATLDGVLRAARPCPQNLDGHVAVYTILNSEWPSVRSRLEEKLARTMTKIDLTLDVFAGHGGYARFLNESASP